MCGRFVLQTSAETVVELFGLSPPPASSEPERTDRPRYNVAPTQPVLVAQGVERGGRAAAWAAWGMLNAQGKAAINARSETVFARPTFRRAVLEGRVLVFADGFIEWKKVGISQRAPYLIRPANGQILVFAGIWDGRRCAILTRPANKDVAELHDRMPVLLGGEVLTAWIDPKLAEKASIRRLFAAFDTKLELRAISSRINSVAHDDAACLDPPEPVRQLDFGFGKPHID